ncbi:hypothetical protein VNO78_11374 [Psophocarpus tetragonolobus]|uniref:Uncharacterized protein n=1 Tax=Psophocarpus tetragonolobus TaxID=3891 RepID=A0AAN9STJ7_PSOTE
MRPNCPGEFFLNTGHTKGHFGPPEKTANENVALLMFICLWHFQIGYFQIGTPQKNIKLRNLLHKPPRLLYKLVHMLHGLDSLEPFHFSVHSIMYDGSGSRVEQSLDSLWFYTNILTCRDECLTDQCAALVEAKERPKRDLQKPNAPSFMNKQQECENVDNLSPSRETKKLERRKRRKWNKVRSSVVGGHYLGLGFDKFKDETWAYHYEMLNIQQQTKMLPFDDDVAMKEHLKSWAYAVACTVR